MRGEGARREENIKPFAESPQRDARNGGAASCNVCARGVAPSAAAVPGGHTWALRGAGEQVRRARRALIGCADRGDVLDRGREPGRPWGLRGAHARRSAAARLDPVVCLSPVLPAGDCPCAATPRGSGFPLRPPPPGAREPATAAGG